MGIAGALTTLSWRRRDIWSLLVVGSSSRNQRKTPGNAEALQGTPADLACKKCVPGSNIISLAWAPFCNLSQFAFALGAHGRTSQCAPTYLRAVSGGSTRDTPGWVAATARATFLPCLRGRRAGPRKPAVQASAGARVSRVGVASRAIGSSRGNRAGKSGEEFRVKSRPRKPVLCIVHCLVLGPYFLTTGSYRSKAQSNSRVSNHMLHRSREEGDKDRERERDRGREGKIERVGQPVLEKMSHRVKD